jgi:hypothetical protein
MIITSITRKISGSNYDNISATATISEVESPVYCAVRLDTELRNMLSAIENKEGLVKEKTMEKERTVSLLETALEYAKDKEIPF